MYKHVNPEEPRRTALAPYNFIPLPQKVYVQNDAQALNAARSGHDRYINGLASGWIDLEIESLTPVFTRAPVVQGADGSWSSRDARLRPEPATTLEGRPMLPGSSLRGMIRTLVEVMAFARMSFVNGAQPFFRTVADDRIGRRYRKLLVRGDEAPPGGFAHRREDGVWEIRPVAEVLRVEHGRVPGLEYKQHPNYRPDWRLQHHKCWFGRGDRRDRVAKLSLGERRPDGDGWEAGTLVLTGSAPKKKREFVFVGEGDVGRVVTIPDALLDRFHDEDQITNWQERAFPRDEPGAGARRAAGYLRHGEPVFFVCDEDRHRDDNPQGLLFFGRAGMFRFPYDKSPDDLLPPHHRRTPGGDFDIAELLFGRVPYGGDDKEAIRSRVRFEDAVATGEAPDGNWFETTMVPAVLSSPKVTAFQHYLTQDGTAHPRDLATYIEGDRVTLRGHKFYWHRGDASVLPDARHAEQKDKLRDLTSPTPRDTQCTVIRPVKARVHFKGRVCFDNLTEVELGALLAALRLPEGHAHKIGMAKPLGFGSVRITAALRRVDRARRYASWVGDGVSEDDDGASCVAKFEKAVFAHAEGSGEALIARREGFGSIARIDALYAMLDHARRPRPEATRSMRIENGDRTRFRADLSGKVNEFKDRPVLPSPHHVVGRPEPAWSGERPATSDARHAAAVRPPPDAARAQAPAARPAPPRGVPTQPAGPAVGRVVAVEVLPETTKKGGAKFVVVGTSWKGVLHPASAQPPVLTPGARLELVVVAGGSELQFKYVAK